MNPTAYLIINGAAIAYDERGEILEAERLEDGTWDWFNAGCCDHRGAGGQEGFRLLAVALDAAEANARFLGEEIVRVPA